MIDCGSLEYAHARILARHGARADEIAWRRIEGFRELSPLLEFARTTGLRPWLAGITADSDAHRIDAVLRRHWRAHIAEVAGWMPEAWQPALAWCATLQDLAPLQHLARGGEPAAWMLDDEAWRTLCAADPARRPAVLGAGALAALQTAWPQPHRFWRAWLAEAQRRLPRRAAGADETLAALLRLLGEHLGAFANAAPGEGWLMREALRARLGLLLRRATLASAAAFVHVALCALDLERLRAELLRRVLFPRWSLA